MYIIISMGKRGENGRRINCFYEDVTLACLNTHNAYVRTAKYNRKVWYKLICIFGFSMDKPAESHGRHCSPEI